MFRTADGAGVRKLYLTGVTPEPVDRLHRVRSDFAKVSLGAERTVPYEKAVSAAQTIAMLKAEGYYVVALEQVRGAVSLARAKNVFGRRKRICLVVGSEVRGIPPSILARCDAAFDIPMRGAKESLNVSVAFGIAAYALAHD